MRGSTVWARTAIGTAVLAVLLGMWVAIYLTWPEDQSRSAGPDDCGPVTPAEQLSLRWLAQLRADGGLPISGIAVGECDSGVRSATTASVEVGRSETVHDFFAERYDCDLEQGCTVADGGSRFRVQQLFTDEHGWRLTARAEPGPGTS
jgi:hypothetical protein